MNEEALQHAKQESNTFKDSLQYLIDAQNQQRLTDEQSATKRYENLVNQINQQRTPVQEQYAANSQQAYINKMLGQKQLDSTLNNMGLNTQGFGVSQMMQNETAYGQNLNALQLDKSRAFRELDNQVTNVTGEHGANMLDLQSRHGDRKLNLMQAIEGQVQNKYNTEYDMFFSNQQYKDSLAQQTKDNSFRERQLSAQRSSSGGSTNPFGGNNNPVTGTMQVNTDYFSGTMPENTFADLQRGAFKTTDKNGNAYQPNNINGNQVTSLKQGNTAVTAAQYFGKKGVTNSSGVVIDNQKIWTIGNNYYIWNGSQMQYEPITKKK